MKMERFIIYPLPHHPLSFSIVEEYRVRHEDRNNENFLGP